MRETIKHGETGFLVKSVTEVEDLVRSNAVAKISPEACRKNAERFSVKAMTDAYEKGSDGLLPITITAGPSIDEHI